MRQPDINRVKRAMEHIEAAKTHLNSIKWENMSDKENRMVNSALESLCEPSSVIKAVISVVEGKV